MLRFVVFFAGLFLSFSVLLGQNSVDSLFDASQDSVRKSVEARNLRLLQMSDSTKRSDSIKEAKLLAQIANVQRDDLLKREALQNKLDSLKKIDDLREAKIKGQVDSLRANTPGFPLVFHGDTILHFFTRLGPFSAAERIKSTLAKIEALVDAKTFDPENLKVKASEETHDLWHGNEILLSVTDRDAFFLNGTRAQVAAQYMESIKTGVEEYQGRTGWLATILRILMLLVVIAGFYFGITYLNKALSALNGTLLKKITPFLKGIKLRNYEFLSAAREGTIVFGVLKVLKWLIIGLLVYMSLPVVFSIFPATKGIAGTLLSYVLNPLKSFIIGLIGYIPELITIIIIVLITRYFVRFLRFLSLEIAAGKLQLPGFYPDWAAPTFNLLKITIYAFSFVVIFPYLPGSDSAVFQGVSVFLGVLFSLGSSSAIGNIVAGLVITYMRAFKTGDRVKIGDTVGDVIEKTMLVTRVRTIKNEYVTIPNSAILNGNTVNYTTSAEGEGLILNTTITIGYDVPWNLVHELLITAANKIEEFEELPEPFVLQKSLDDFYVAYEINAYTKYGNRAAGIYSKLHANIQDGFNEAGVEILSPHYVAARDGSSIALPEKYKGALAKPAPFTVKVEK